MEIKIYNGTVMFARGVWKTNEDNERVIEKEESMDNVEKSYNFENVPALSEEQLFYILSTTIKEESGSTRPIYINNMASTVKEVSQFPNYSEKFSQIEKSKQ